MVSVLSFFVLGLILVLAGMVLVPAFFGSPWHPLSSTNIRRILDFAGIKAGEKFFDAGSGEGRVLIAAAKDYGAAGVGVEIDPLKVWIARQLAKLAGVENRIRFVRKNLFDFDYSEADVLYLYLTHQAMDRLFPKIRDTLKPSVRIVCFRFCLRGMTPVRVNKEKTLFLYRLDKGKRIDEFS